MYVTGSGSEEYNMNLLADALVPYLLSNGIQYKRNQPDMTAGSSVRDANTGYYDLYLALHSNASPEGRYGENRGIIAFYYPGSTQGQRAAELIVEELRDIYPLPNQVTTRSTTTLGEVRLPNAPAVLVAGRPLGCHCPAAGKGVDPLFRPAFYLSHGPGDGDGFSQLWDAEPAELPILHWHRDCKHPEWGLCHGLWRVAGLVCGAL